MHETRHGWLILDGGFEQDSSDDVRWRAPGDLESYEGGTIHHVHVGDRGCRCLVFEELIPGALQEFLSSGRLTRTGELKPAAPLPDWIGEVDAFIAARFHGPLRAGDVARHVGLHRSHLVREYRRWRGRTVADQVRMLRLAYARSLLVQRALPLPELALEAGFADQSHFTREFALRFGTSPRRYASLAAPSPSATAGRS